MANVERVVSQRDLIKHFPVVKIPPTGIPVSAITGRTLIHLYSFVVLIQSGGRLSSFFAILGRQFGIYLLVGRWCHKLDWSHVVLRLDIFVTSISGFPWNRRIGSK